MVCPTCGLRRVAFHEDDGNPENDENNPSGYKQRAENWICGNHENDENHGNPWCKPRVPQTTTGLEIPNKSHVNITLTIPRGERFAERIFRIRLSLRNETFGANVSRPFGPKMPKGPFRTKNAIAMEIVVFCYRGSVLLSAPIRCHLNQEKQYPNYYCGSELLSR